MHLWLAILELFILIALAVMRAENAPPVGPIRVPPIDWGEPKKSSFYRCWGNDNWGASISINDGGWDFAMGVRWAPKSRPCNLAIYKAQWCDTWTIQWVPDPVTMRGCKFIDLKRKKT